MTDHIEFLGTRHPRQQAKVLFSRNPKLGLGPAFEMGCRRTTNWGTCLRGWNRVSSFYDAVRGVVAVQDV